MKKIAFFVEGQTEVIFVRELVKQIAGTKNIVFKFMRQLNGNLIEDISTYDTENENPSENEIYILFVNCCTDNQVTSQVIRKHNSLKSEGYIKIIALRDLYPATNADIANFHLPYQKLPADRVDTELVIAIREIEAWFIDELTHFAKIHPEMTIEAITEKGFDLKNTRGYQWDIPALVLHNIYSHWKLAYRKREHQVNRTVNSLDWEELHINVRNYAPSLDQLITSVENALFN